LREQLRLELERADAVVGEREHRVVAALIGGAELLRHRLAYRRRGRGAVCVDLEARVQPGLDRVRGEQAPAPGMDRLDDELIERGAQRADALERRRHLEPDRAL